MKNLSIQTLFALFVLPAVVFIYGTDKCLDSAKVKKNRKNQFYGKMLLKVVENFTETLEEAELLLKEITDVNMVVGKYGGTLLMEASYQGHTNIVERLLKKGAKPDMKDRFGETALMKASGMNHPKVVRKLITSGANPHMVDDFGKTAFQQASRRLSIESASKDRCAEMVKLLEPVKKEKCVVDPYNSDLPYASLEEIRESAAIAERTKQAVVKQNK